MLSKLATDIKPQRLNSKLVGEDMAAATSHTTLLSLFRLVLYSFVADHSLLYWSHQSSVPCIMNHQSSVPCIMSLKRAPLSSLTNTTIPTCGRSSIKKRRSESKSGDVKTHDSPFQSLRDAWKADSSALDGKRSLLLDLQGHVTYSQHSVEPSMYLAYGMPMARR